jgi:hypothetical protein
MQLKRNKALESVKGIIKLESLCITTDYSIKSLILQSSELSLAA